MFRHVKQLQYTVRVAEPNRGSRIYCSNSLAALRASWPPRVVISPGISDDDPGRKDMLMDIATEELSHLEIIGTLVGMLNKGAKGAWRRAPSEAELYRSLTANGNDSHITSLLYGGGTPLTNSAGVPWTAAYIDTIGEPTADLRSNVAAEARAKIVYERLINVTDDHGVKDALAFLMTAKRRISSLRRPCSRFATTIHRANCRPLASTLTPTTICLKVEKYAAAGTVTNTSIMSGSQPAVDGGDGSASVGLTPEQEALCKAMLKRTQSDPQGDLDRRRTRRRKQTLHHRLSDVRMSRLRPGDSHDGCGICLNSTRFIWPDCNSPLPYPSISSFRPSPSALPATLWCLRGCGCEPG